MVDEFGEPSKKVQPSGKTAMQLHIAAAFFCPKRKFLIKFNVLIFSYFRRIKRQTMVRYYR